MGSDGVGTVLDTSLAELWRAGRSGAARQEGSGARRGVQDEEVAEGVRVRVEHGERVDVVGQRAGEDALAGLLVREALEVRQVCRDFKSPVVRAQSCCALTAIHDFGPPCRDVGRSHE